MQLTPPLTRELVLIGGGHTHALVLRRWGMAPLPGARLTLINPGPTAPYTGMLPGYVAGHYAHDDLMIDLVRLARFAGARVPDGSRVSYGVDPAPGTPIPASDAYTRIPNPDHFAVLTLVIAEADIVHLSADYHRRALFSREDAWAGQWLAP